MRQQRREVYRPDNKLLPGSERFELITYLLRQRLSPEQITGRLKTMDITNLKKAYVCRETIYDATATSAVQGFSAALSRMPMTARKTLTYDRGREMARHAQITQNTGYPKGTDLSVVMQDELDAIAYELNIRPRKRFDFKNPIEMMVKHQSSPESIQ